MSSFDEHNWYLLTAVLALVELVEVAEGVLVPSDHLGTHPDRFLFKIVQRSLRVSMMV